MTLNDFMRIANTLPARFERAYGNASELIDLDAQLSYQKWKEVFGEWVKIVPSVEEAINGY